MVPSNYDMARKMQSHKRKDLKRKLIMPSKKAQQKIEHEMCKNSKYASYVELRLDSNRKMLLKQVKSKGCYDEEAAQHSK